VVGYAFNPIYLIPDPIPILGYFDDLILVPLGIPMADKLYTVDLVSFKDLLMANSTMADALVQMLIEKGVISQNVDWSQDAT